MRAAYDGYFLAHIFFLLPCMRNVPCQTHVVSCKQSKTCKQLISPVISAASAPRLCRACSARLLDNEIDKAHKILPCTRNLMCPYRHHFCYSNIMHLHTCDRPTMYPLYLISKASPLHTKAEDCYLWGRHEGLVTQQSMLP